MRCVAHQVLAGEAVSLIEEGGGFTLVRDGEPTPERFTDEGHALAAFGATCNEVAAGVSRPVVTP